MVKKSNQITYNVYKAPVNTKTDLYVMIEMEEFMGAMQDLSGNAFKVWCYMAKNKWEYQEELSSKYCKEKCGLGKTAYDNGIKELKEKGYLVDVNKQHSPEDKANYWQFRATPWERKQQNNNEEKQAETPSAFSKDDTDFDFS